MSLDLARLLIDFGFVVLIWAVQLVIYPSFGFYAKANLFEWHKSYTARVTFIVLPLMFSQLIISCLQLWNMQNWYTVVSFVIIIVLWLQTFLIFVPLHQSIDAHKPIKDACNKLVRKNWGRTVLWSLLFVMSLIYFLINTK